MGIGGYFNKGCWGYWIFILKKIKLGLYFLVNIKMNFKWIRELNFEKKEEEVI